MELGQAINDSLNWPSWKYFMAWASSDHTAQTNWTYGNVQSYKSVGETTQFQIFRHATDTDFWYWAIDGTTRKNSGGTLGLHVAGLDPSGFAVSTMERDSTADTGKAHWYDLQWRKVSPQSWALWDQKYTNHYGGETLDAYWPNGTYEWYSLTP